MTNEEIIQNLRVHLDQNLDCDNCSLKDFPLCFNWLINETISKLEENEKENERLSLLYSDMANEIARLKSMTGER